MDKSLNCEKSLRYMIVSQSYIEYSYTVIHYCPFFPNYKTIIMYQLEYLPDMGSIPIL